MTIDDRLTAMRDVIQRDVNKRGLASDPRDNLLTACPGDFAAACRSIAEVTPARVAVVTGFYIPTAEPPAGETDGPLGAVFLARALTRLGDQVMVLSDPFCRRALEVGLEASHLTGSVPIVDVLHEDNEWYLPWAPTHFVALERVGPSHDERSLAAQADDNGELRQRFAEEVPPERRNRCHSMRGRDITELMRQAESMFEPRAEPTIGIGDGGNEIGMGKIPWDTIRRNIPNGGLVACRVPTDHLIVAGISNWGAYALAAGVALLRGQTLPPEMFDGARERDILRIMVEQGPLVDGVTGKQTVTVDGLSFEDYAQPLQELAKLSRV